MPKLTVTPDELRPGDRLEGLGPDRSEWPEVRSVGAPRKDAEFGTVLPVRLNGDGKPRDLPVGSPIGVWRG